MSRPQKPGQNRRTIVHLSKPAIVVAVLCTLTFVSARADEDTSPAHTKGTTKASPPTLSKQDGLSVVAAARSSHVRREGSDCSHLVHAAYERAGFSYPYADSSDLYRGTEQFRRVEHPQPGDLIVWRGHVGIVFNPARHTFFSALSRGPGTDKYNARYWRRRGTPRFYRYVKAEESRAIYHPE